MAYELVIFMKIQFFFEDGAAGLAWSGTERTKFIQDWQIAVRTAWSGRRIKVLRSGKHVSVRLDFAVQEGGWMFDHWEVTVTKIGLGTFQRSYVNVGAGNVQLDSEDLTGVPKGGGHMQRGAVHEFGHMLGLDDEYSAGSPHSGDSPAIMNSGEQVRSRHDDTLTKWAGTGGAKGDGGVVGSGGVVSSGGAVGSGGGGPAATGGWSGPAGTGGAAPPTDGGPVASSDDVGGCACTVADAGAASSGRSAARSIATVLAGLLLVFVRRRRARVGLHPR